MGMDKLVTGMFLVILSVTPGETTSTTAVTNTTQVYEITSTDTPTKDIFTPCEHNSLLHCKGEYCGAGRTTCKVPYIGKES